MITIIDENLYTLADVSQMLGVTRNSITKYVKGGRLKVVTIGGKKYVSEKHLKEFITTPDSTTKNNEE